MTVNGRARKIVYDLSHRDTDWKCCIEDDGALSIIIDALTAERQQVWVHVIAYLESQERKPLLMPLSEQSLMWNDAQETFVDWCREQAKKEQP